MIKLAPGLDAAQLRDMLAERIPAGRAGTRMDIAAMALFLCTPIAGFITGETIVVDGGAWLWSPPPMPADLVRELSRGIEKTSRSKM